MTVDWGMRFFSPRSLHALGLRRLSPEGPGVEQLLGSGFGAFRGCSEGRGVQHVTQGSLLLPRTPNYSIYSLRLIKLP